MKLISALLFITTVLLSSCRWDDSYSEKAFLHYSSVYNGCYDLKGQDPLSYFRITEFGEYEDYSSLFSGDQSKTYLVLRTEIRDGVGAGVGELSIAYADGTSLFENYAFEYTATRVSLSVVRVYGKWTDTRLGVLTYNIYWYRLNIDLMIEGLPRRLTFQFWCNKDTGYPPEFDTTSENNRCVS